MRTKETRSLILKRTVTKTDNQSSIDAWHRYVEKGDMPYHEEPPDYKQSVVDTLTVRDFDTGRPLPIRWERKDINFSELCESLFGRIPENGKEMIVHMMIVDK